MKKEIDKLISQSKTNDALTLLNSFYKENENEISVINFYKKEKIVIQRAINKKIWRLDDRTKTNAKLEAMTLIWEDYKAPEEEKIKKEDLWFFQRLKAKFNFWKTLNKKREEKKYAITPKTAVAYGQINITNFELNMDRLKKSAFSWNVYKFLPAKAKLELIISRQDTNNDWKFFSKIKNNEVIVYFSSDMRDDLDGCSSTSLEFDDENNGKYLYIRNFGDNEIEYVIQNEKTENIIPDKVEKKILINT